MSGSQWVRNGTIVVVLSTVLSGCASVQSFVPSRASFGVRPDIPIGPASEEVEAECSKVHGVRSDDDRSACLAFYSTVEYSANLEEAYRSRATQNRWWIYVAGTVGLGTVAAGGALAAVSAASLGTIALLNISGGATASFFAFLDNARLADIYTVAANDIAGARSCAQEVVGNALSAKATGSGTPGSGSVRAAYLTERGALQVAIADARRLLEIERTNAASAAQQRAKEQAETLKTQIAQIQKELDAQREAAEEKKKAEEERKKEQDAKKESKKATEAATKAADDANKAKASNAADAGEKETASAKKKEDATRKVKEAEAADTVASKQEGRAELAAEKASKASATRPKPSATSCAERRKTSS